MFLKFENLPKDHENVVAGGPQPWPWCYNMVCNMLWFCTTCMVFIGISTSKVSSCQWMMDSRIQEQKSRTKMDGKQILFGNPAKRFEEDVKIFFLWKFWTSEWSHMMEHMHQKHPKTPLEIIKCIEMLLETLSFITRWMHSFTRKLYHLPEIGMSSM